jgi:acylphosphatase
MPTIVARRCFVSGRVQGVFFRASTRQKAIDLGCAGYARNLPDGRVEVLAVAELHAIQRLIDWLWQGPPSAEVRDVEVVELEIDQLDDVPVGFGTS